ncbi:MAG: divK [Candidatus Angelobacter sp.]|jgi:two-component system cell cycle response regulator DivK|nr:divK [Candidatus Angelobacter sp.]
MKTILIAEDYSANRELIREMLEAGGYRVIQASDGQEAFEKIVELRPDLVLADIQMPVLDGYGLVQKIRDDSSVCNLKVIALTAYAMDGDREKVLAAGFDGYITKPLDMKTLYREVSKYLAVSLERKAGM